MPVNNQGQIIDDTGMITGTTGANLPSTDPLPDPRIANEGRPGYDVFGNPVAGTPLPGGGSSTSPVITVDQLGGTPRPITVPPAPAGSSTAPTPTPSSVTPPSDVAPPSDSLTEQISQLLQPPKSVGSPEVAEEQKAARDAAKKAANDAKNRIAAIEAEEQAVVDAAKAEVDRVRAEIEANAQNGGMTIGSFNTAFGFREAEVNRNANTKLIGIQSRLASARANYQMLLGNQAAAQDILDTAQERLDTAWKTKTTDAQNMRDYKLKLYGVLTDRADKKQAIALQEKRDREQRAYSSVEGLRNDIHAAYKDINYASAVKLAIIDGNLPLVPTDAQLLQARKDIQEVMKGATMKGASSGVDVAKFKEFFPNVDITTPAGQQQYLNWQTKEAAAGRETTSGSGLTPFQVISTRNQIEDNLRQNPAVVAFGQLVNFGVPVLIGRFNSGQTSNVTDTVLMRGLAKVTDPSTGVREEEYRTFEDAVGALNRIYKLPSKWIGKGSLTDAGRAAMVREIQDRYDGRLNDYNQQYGYYSGQAGQLGITIPPSYTTTIPNYSTGGTSGGSGSDVQMVGGVIYKKGTDGLYYPETKVAPVKTSAKPAPLLSGFSDYKSPFTFNFFK